MIQLPPPSLILWISQMQRLKTGQLTLFPLIREITWWLSECYEQDSPVVQDDPCYKDEADLCHIVENSLVSCSTCSGFSAVKQNMPVWPGMCCPLWEKSSFLRLETCRICMLMMQLAMTCTSYNHWFWKSRLVRMVKATRDPLRGGLQPILIHGMDECLQLWLHPSDFISIFANHNEVSHTLTI